MNDIFGLVDAKNEIWPLFMTNSKGRAYVTVDKNFLARTDAKSVVIHDTPNATSGSGAKMLCADLLAVNDADAWDDLFKSGKDSFDENPIEDSDDEADESSDDEDLPDYVAGNMSVIDGYTKPEEYDDMAGRAVMERDDGKTMTTVSAWNLRANATYKAHVHLLPCADGAGGHYMNDVNGAVDAVNEIWPIFTTDASGRGYAEVTNNFIARDTAASVVIHDTPNASEGSGDKMLCANLNEVDDESDWEADLEDDKDEYGEVQETDNTETETDDTEESADYDCPAADELYELKEGSHPKKCGVEDVDGNLQADVSLCTLNNNLRTDCNCSVDGKYYCVPH